MMTQQTYLFAGASSKVAIETAMQLQAQGHRVIGISTKTENPIYDVFYTIEKYAFNTFPEIKEPIDGLIYFPGTINLKPFYRLTERDFMADYEVNSQGAVAFTQAYLPNLKARKNASIVYFSTVAVAVGMPFHASISMAKGAVEGLTKALAAELAPAVRVNCIAPSLTDTPLAEKLLNTPDKVTASQKRNPLQKVGSPTDLANAAVFLLTSQSSWITGQILAVDGGMNHLKLL
jgi:NAD(P)-dependent dehydrogenase (short-subunit alcohol dehydrogenase family)